MPMEDKIYSIAFLLTYMAIIWLIVSIAWSKRPKKRTPAWNWSFGSFVLLAFGDFFHLVPRTYLWYLFDIKGQTDVYTTDLGIILYGFGLIMTSITVTLFYFGMYMFWRHTYATNEDIKEYSNGDLKLQYLDIIAITSVLFRLCLIAYPMNAWGSEPDFYGGWFSFRYLTNIPLYIIGIEVIVLFLRGASKGERQEAVNSATNQVVKQSAIWIIISYVCYSITVFGVQAEPLLGMFMIPKTIAYLIILYLFYKNYWLVKNEQHSTN